MANITTLPEEGQILVDIEDLSMLKDIKKAISIVKSVGKITLPKRRRYSSYERSMRDLLTSSMRHPVSFEIKG